MTRRDLSRALSMEWRRIATLRSTFVLAVAALAASGAESLLRGLDLGAIVDARAAADLVAAPRPPLSMLFLAAFGALAWGHDHRYRTHGVVLTVMPRRGVLVAARGIVSLGAAAVVSLLAAGSALFWATVGSGGDMLDHLGAAPLGRVVAGAVLVDIAGALFGLAVGALVRSATAAMSIALVVPAMIEPLAAIAANRFVAGSTRWFPFTAALGASQAVPADDVPAFGVAQLVLYSVVAVLVAAAFVEVVRRDA